MADSHDVYFGSTNPPPFVGNQTATEYTTGQLAQNTTYYWRIDERNYHGVTTGDVWQFSTRTVLRVNASNPNPGTGDSWETAFDGLQDALTWLQNHPPPNPIEAWVAEGTYKPTSPSGRAATFQLVNGVSLYGGFAGTESSLNQRNPSAHVTTLSGDIGTVGQVADNTYHVVTGSGTNSTAVLDGFVIERGNADDGSPHDAGGGMYNEAGSPTVRNCRFRANIAKVGAGMYSKSFSSPEITNCAFTGNSAGDAGSPSARAAPGKPANGRTVPPGPGDAWLSQAVTRIRAEQPSRARA